MVRKTCGNLMGMGKIALVACVAAVGLAGFADEIDWNAISEYVTLETSDASYAETSLLHPAHWSDTKIPHGDAHYMVPNGKTLYGIASTSPDSDWMAEPTNSTFQGASLSVGGTFVFNFRTIRVNNLRLLDGFVYQNNSYGAYYGTATVASVQTPADFRLVRNGDVKFPVISATFLGDSSAQVRFRRYNNNRHAGFKLTGSDFSRYFGTVINGPGNDGRGGGTNIYGNVVMPGTCLVAADSSIQLESDAKTALIGTLQMEAGSTLYLPASKTANASVIVTNRFVAAAGAKLNVENAHAAVVTERRSRLALVKLIGAAALAENLPDLDALSLEWIKDVNLLPTDGLLPEDGALSLEDDESTGGKTIFATFRPINRLTTTSTSKKSAFSMDAAEAPSYWTLGHVPQAGEDAYLAELGATLATVDDDYVFPGETLTVGAKGTLYLQSSGFYAGIVHAMAGSTLEDVGTPSGKTIEGFSSAQGLYADELWIYGTDSSPCTFAVAQGRNYVVTAPLRGTGTIRANTRSATGYPRGIIAFLADNSAFAGRFIATSLNDRGKLDSATGYRLQFYMDSANNVGGAMAAFAYNGFTVAEDSIVIGRHALTFSEPTRGVFVQNRARFVMNGGDGDNRLTFAAPVTWRGEMVFGNDYPNASSASTGTGGGDLVLGGRAQFLNDDNSVSDTPDAGSTSNRLLMVVGRVKPTVTNALDGVAVTFGANSGGILLDINPAGDGMADYGLVDVKWDVPFTTSRADGKIPVTFEGMATEEHSGAAFSRAICTVNATAAQTLTADTFAVAKPFSNVTVKVESSSNLDGSVTYRATFAVAGFSLLIR